MRKRKEQYISTGTLPSSGKSIGPDQKSADILYNSPTLPPEEEKLLEEHALETVHELHAVFGADFEDTEKNIQLCLPLVDTATQEYLNKLLPQLKTAGRLLLEVDEINGKYARKLVSLWKYIQQDDISDFLKKKFLASLTTSPAGLLKKSGEDPGYLKDELINPTKKLSIEEKKTGSETERSMFRTEMQSGSGPEWDTSTEESWSLNSVNNYEIWPLNGIVKAFQDACPEYDLISFEINHNPERWSLYSAYRAILKKLTRKFEEQLLWHGAGTSRSSAEEICAQGFRREQEKNFSLGIGTYFNKNPRSAIRIEDVKLESKDLTLKLLPSLVAVGSLWPGTRDMSRPPVRNDSLLRYDNLVDTLGRPQVYLTHNDHQAFPLGILTVKLKSPQETPASASSIPESSIPPQEQKTIPMDTTSSISSGSVSAQGIPQLRMVNEFRPYILNTFKSHKEIIEQRLKDFDPETHVNPYLKTLLVNMDLATKILNQEKPVTPQQAVTIIALWKCVRFLDAINYFTKHHEKRPQSGSESLLPDPLDPEIETYFKELFKDVAINGQTAIVWALNQDKEFEKIYVSESEPKTVGYGDSNWSRLRESLKIPPFSLALIRLNLVEAREGQIRNAVMALMVCWPHYKIKDLVVNYNPFELDMYMKLKKAYKKRIPETKEILGWYGTTFSRAQLIFSQGFKRDVATPLSHGNYFTLDPGLALAQMPEEPDGTKTLIVAQVLVGDVCEGYPALQRKPGSLGFFTNHVDDLKKTEVISTIIEDSQVYPLLSLRAFRAEDKPTGTPAEKELKYNEIRQPPKNVYENEKMQIDDDQYATTLAGTADKPMTSSSASSSSSSSGSSDYEMSITPGM